MFAESYLQKQNKTALIKSPPTEKLGISVIIPCFREPEILRTLQSLANCFLPKCNVEVIVLINHPENSDTKTKLYNQKSKIEIEKWIFQNQKAKLGFVCVGPIELKKKWAGAGVARKTAMDEAVRRFNLIENAEGIIVSLDADTLVQKNYLLEIENHFLNNPDHVGATIAFEHQKNDLEPFHLRGIEYYERYLKYYKKALEFTGYPFSMFTIGSAFAVKALAYVKRGGMNRRQAGEDFYFLQGLVQIGKVGEILKTKVFPSARVSDRVPFGTGPILQKWLNGDENLCLTYNFGAFHDLKMIFCNKEKFYQLNEIQFYRFIEVFPKPILEFLKTDNIWSEINDLNQNCSSLKTFEQRFFQKFNAFKILKYLNFVHEYFYEKADLDLQIERLENAIKC